jgi:hypothetical protein
MRDSFYTSGQNRIVGSHAWGNSLDGAWSIASGGINMVEQQVGSWQNGVVQRVGNNQFFRIEDRVFDDE